MGNKKNIIIEKSFDFAVEIIELYKFLNDNEKEYILSKQLLRSGTSIGANVHEAQEAISRKDFFSKMYIALKESRETEYWINLLEKTNYLIKYSKLNLIKSNCDEIIKILVSITKNKTGEND